MNVIKVILKGSKILKLFIIFFIEKKLFSVYKDKFLFSKSFRNFFLVFSENKM